MTFLKYNKHRREPVTSDKKRFGNMSSATVNNAMIGSVIGIH